MNLPVTRTVNLTSTSTGNTFYSDSSCTAAITNVDIAAGTSAASFYFSDTVVGTPTLTAGSSGPPTLTSATQVETIQATGVASELAFLGAPQTLPAGACSAPLTVEAEDILSAEKRELTVDLVVLATGMAPSLDGGSAPRGVALDGDGFVLADTSAEGVVAAGCARGPVDVATATQEGTAAALRAIQAIQAAGRR